MATAIDFVKLNRLMLRWLHVLCGMPTCVIDKLGILQDLPREELRFYEHIRGPIRSYQIVYISACSIWILKGLYFLIYMIAAVITFERVAVNKESKANTTYKTTFGCLSTNCQQLGENNTFYGTLNQLPVFAICHPSLNRIYLPLTGVHSFGFGIYAVFLLIISMGEFLYPIELHWHPRLPDSVVFPVAPVSSIGAHRERARKCLIKVFVSMQNYDSVNQEDKLSRSLQAAGRQNIVARYMQARYYRASTTDLPQVKMGAFSLESNYVMLDGSLQEYLGRYVPAARSHGRSVEAAKTLAILWTGLFAQLTFSFGLGAWVLIFMQDSISQELHRIDSFAQQTGCSFWIGDSSAAQDLVPISLGASVHHHNWVYAFDYLLVWVPGAYIMSGSIAMAVAALKEVEHMLQEQLDEITSTLNAQSLIYEPSTPMQERVSDFVDSMVKIYIKNRIIKSIALDSSRLATLILWFAYAANYISVIIMASGTKMFSSSTLAPIALAMIGFTVTNTLIIVSSRVQSAANRMIKSMWTLVAATDSIADLRVRHVRRLIIKQVLVISDEPMMKIVVFGLPVTYASLFEAVIWSSTLAIYCSY